MLMLANGSLLGGSSRPSASLRCVYGLGSFKEFKCPVRNSRYLDHSLGFFFGTVWNDGIDSSMTTQGNLSSRKIAFCGTNGVGSSSDAIVKSIVSESLLSSKNKCVPQHAANERIRFAYAILRGSPFVTIKSCRGTDPHST